MAPGRAGNAALTTGPNRLGGRVDIQHMTSSAVAGQVVGQAVRWPAGRATTFDAARLASERPEPAVCDPARVSRATGTAMLVLGCILFAALSRAAFLSQPFRNDSGLYVYMGKVVADGGRLYHDFYENKPPGVGLLGAACWRLFGAHWVGYVALQWAMMLGASLLLARAARRQFGLGAWRPTFACAMILLNFSLAVFTGFQLETMQAFFAVIAACAAMESLATWSLADTFLLGLAAGCAAMIKPTGLAVLGAWALVVLWNAPSIGARTFVRHLLVAAVAAMLPNAGVLVWVLRSGLWPDMAPLFEQIRLYGQQTPLDDLLPLRLLMLLAFLGFPLLVRGWVFRRRRLQDARGRGGITPQRLPRTMFWFALAWLALEGLGVFVQGRMYLYHFLVVFPPVALGFGMLPRTDRLAPIALSLGPWALLSLVWSLPAIAHIPDGAAERPVSRYLRAHTAPGDAIYADQTPRYLLETGRRPGSRLGTLFYFVNYDDAPQHYCRILLSDFQQRRPKFIVLDADLTQSLYAQEQLPLLASRPRRLANFRQAWHAINRYLAEHYVLQGQVDDQLVYRRRCDGDPPVMATAHSRPAAAHDAFPPSASPDPSASASVNVRPALLQ